MITFLMLTSCLPYSQTNCCGDEIVQYNTLTKGIVLYLAAVAEILCMYYTYIILIPVQIMEWHVSFV